MKRLIFILLIISLSSLFAAQTTSYNPNAPISVNESIAKEIKANYARTGNLTSYENQAITDYQNKTTMTYTAQLSGSRDTYQADPDAVNYWTGTTDGATKTDVSEVRGLDGEDGWFMFDISGIPNGSVINSIDFNGYVNFTYYPWWSMTPVTSDPLTASAADLFADINAEATTSADCYLYQNEGSTYAVGAKQYTLGGTANADLQAAMGQGWFAMGMASRDNSTSYYLNWDG